ncbi:hypothetical protein AAG570_003731 [Ranatra chinensis]|uniref:Uncharacterized protein n=1 Tax=Ranatra chinensis TaxID=642074 RepID=A0ABD0Y4H0_9HEMI
MVNMAETESMFLGPNRLPLNGVVSDDSEAELEAPSILMTPYQQNASAGSQRRNKRKNFQPRNILYSEEEEEEEESALDLSSSEPESKRFKQEEEEQEEEEHPTWVNPVENEAVEESPPVSPRPRGFQLLQQAFLGGQPPPDASDIREYAQNTVKELLEIYGLNGPEVAESITNNVPIANFSSGES